MICSHKDRLPGEDRGRDQSYAAINQRMPGTPRAGGDKLQRDHGPADALTSDF